MTAFLLPTADATPCLGETDLQDLSAWLRLANASGLPLIALRALLAEFGGPQAVLNQPFGALAGYRQRESCACRAGSSATLGTRLIRRMPGAHARVGVGSRQQESSRLPIQGIRLRF